MEETIMQKQEKLRAAFEAINNFNAILGKDRFNKDNSLRMAIRSIRRFIRENTLIDPFHDRLQHNKNSFESTKGFLRTSYGSMWFNRSMDVYPKDIWLDNYCAWRRDPENVKLKNKKDFFRIGDDFYNKDDYIEYEGKAYSKENYILLGDSIVERSKAAICNYYVYENGSYMGTHKELALAPNSDEEFIRNDSSTDTEVIVMLSGGTGSRLFCNDFVKSMFRIGNKRIMPTGGNCSNIYLTKEELKNFNLKISDSHALALLSKEENSKELQNFVLSREDRVNAGKNKIMELLAGQTFRIEFSRPQRGSSLKQKLMNLIVCKLSRRRYNKAFYGVKELFTRLKAVNKMYEVEEQYAD